MTKVKFTMLDGKVIIGEVEVYNADQVTESLNSRDTGEYIAFGDVGFAKHAVKYFEPYTNEL